MNAAVGKWIKRVEKTDRGLTATLRGIIAIGKDEDAERLTFVWLSNFHCDKGRESTARIRKHLGPFQDWEIEHVSVPEMSKKDAMLDEALKLGGRLVGIEE
jgi:hypothetical protein